MFASWSMEISMDGVSWQLIEVRGASPPCDLCCMSSFPSMLSLLSLPAVAVQQSRNATKIILKKQPRISHDKSVKCYKNSQYHSLYWAIFPSCTDAGRYICDNWKQLPCAAFLCKLFKLVRPISDFQLEALMWSCGILIECMHVSKTTLRVPLDGELWRPCSQTAGCELHWVELLHDFNDQSTG